MSKIFDRFVEKTPVSVMARAAMEHAMAPEALDALFVEHADKQYMRKLLFSSVVVWIADRNFCTFKLLSGIAERLAFFCIRHHANMTVVSSGTLMAVGGTETGQVFEQVVTIMTAEGGSLKARRIVLRLDKPTRDGDAEMAILTSLPENAVDAVTVAALYRNRWTLETMFQSLTMMFQGEIATLGHPQAALFGFGVALAAYNVLSTVQTALRAEFGGAKGQEEVSGYYIANEVRATASGMAIAVEPLDWEAFQTMTPTTFAKELRSWATHVKLQKLKRHPRGLKKPVPKRTQHVHSPHVSPAQLLAKLRGK